MKEREVLAEATYNTRVGKIGNSKGFTIPMTIVQDMMLEDKDMVIVTIRRAKTEFIVEDKL